MNKKLRNFLIGLIILIVGYFIIDQLFNKVGEYLFKTEIINAEEVAGKTDNNDLGIRNDVYDVIQKEYVEKMNLNEDEKILIYNISYIMQKNLENFTDSSQVIQYWYLYKLLLKCEYNEKDKIIKHFLEYDGQYRKSFKNTKERELAFRWSERIISNNYKEIDSKDYSLEKCRIFKKNLKSQGF